jgi:DNA polymerase III delta prime subunit
MIHIRIPATSSGDVIGVLSRVAAAEQIEVASGLLDDIAHVADGNLRRAIFTFEMLARRGMAGDRGKLFEVIAASSLSAAREMVEMALRGRVIEWRWEKQRGRNVRKLEGAMGKLDEMVGNHALDGEDIIQQVHAELIGSRLMLAAPLRQDLLAALSRCDVAIHRSMHTRIQLEHFLHKVADAGKKHGLALA